MVGIGVIEDEPFDMARLDKWEKIAENAIDDEPFDMSRLDKWRS